MSLNRVVLVGRLTKDPEIKYSQSGTGVCRFTLAVNRQFKKDGQDEADFISVICFNKTAENLVNYQKKGALIGVDGRIQTGRYEKDGQTVFTTDVVADSIQFLSSKNDSQQPGQAQQPVQQQQYQQPMQQQFQQQQPQYQQMSTTHLTPMNPQQGQQFAQQMGAQVVNDDPFAQSKGPINVSMDDLPF